MKLNMGRLRNWWRSDGHLLDSLEHALQMERDGRLQSAIDEMTDVVKRYPQSHGHRRQLVRMLEKGGRLDAVEAHLRDAAADPSSPAKTMRTVCEVLLRQRRHQEALPLLHAALARYPGDPDLIGVLTDLFIDDGRAGDALSALDKGAPRSADARLELCSARALVALGRLEE